MANRLIRGRGFDPWRNLAVERELFSAYEGDRILYLWQNADTVVIGRNQNPWKECDLGLMEAEGARLARRGSGGGAVFHDLGNLNFTFMSPLGDHDVIRQLHLIQKAVLSLGIETVITGRNDLVVAEGGRKFSGSAFQRSRTRALHHGTILIDSDLGKLARYLRPSKRKLSAKGVDSVSSRVCNLKALNPGLSIAAMEGALLAAFEGEYGGVSLDSALALDEGRIAAYEREYASWEWRIGKAPDFDVDLSERFPWGEVQLLLGVRHGLVREARVYSDALDEEMVSAIGPALVGCRFTSEALGARLKALGFPETEEVAQWLLGERI